MCLVDCAKADIPLYNVHKQCPCCALNRLHDNLVLGRHGRIGELERVEVEDTGQDLICSIWSTVNKHAQAVEGRSHEQAVTILC